MTRWKIEAVVLYLYLETVGVAYRGKTLVSHKICIYKELGTGSDKKYWWYIPALDYKCPPYVRHQVKTRLFQTPPIPSALDT